MDREQREQYLQALLETTGRTTVVLLVVDQKEPDEPPPAVEGEVIHTQPIRKPVFFMRGKTPFLLTLVTLGIVVFTLVSFVLTFILPQLHQTAIVTLVPQQNHFTTKVTVPTQVRVLAPQSFAMAKTVPTTGTGHQEATNAQGYITFYNAAPYMQTVPAGTLLVGADGVHIVTTSDTPLPPGNPPLEGQVTVTARAVMTGSGGNIPPLDITGQCCRENIFVKNLSSFQGGQESRDFPIVTQADRDTAVSTLTTMLQQSAVTSFTMQLDQGEALLPPVCSSKTGTDKNVGQQASHVTVTLSLTCTGCGYNKGTLQAALTQGYLSQARSSLGNSYTLVGSVVPTALQIADHGTSQQITVSCQGNLIYAFTSQQQKHLVTLIAGKSKAAAFATLLTLPSISQVRVTITPDAATLPQDVTRIALVIEG